jgi:glycosyltransferase involved in cell wall biosynthesis
MRIAIDSRTLMGRNTGDRTVFLGLAKGLLARHEGHEVICVLDQPIPAEVIAPQPHFQVALRRFPPGKLWIHGAFPAACRQVQADVAAVNYNTPYFSPCPVVTLIHDVSWLTLPETLPAAAVKTLRAFIPGSIRRAGAVIAGSHFSADEIVHYYPQAAGKTHVVTWGVDPLYRPVTDPQDLAAVRQKYGLPERFILSVGVLQPRKNVERLLRAYGQLPAEVRRECGLVITGKRGWLDETITRVAAEVGEGVQFTGYVEDEELPALYTLATCLAYPSLYEGFGLPVVEAMACGTPVLTSTAASLPEAAGGAALLVVPTDTEALADGLRRLVTDEDLREGLRRRGLERAAELTWEKSAGQLLAVLEGVVGVR